MTTFSAHCISDHCISDQKVRTVMVRVRVIVRVMVRLRVLVRVMVRVEDAVVRNAVGRKVGNPHHAVILSRIFKELQYS